MSRGQRRLAAIMFTDMVGYTALGQVNEQLSLAAVEQQRRLIRPILKRHSGREVKTAGDQFLVEFLNALDAVRCAYDIQRATREFNISLAEAQRIHLRIGIHLGDIVESRGDISGDAVNIASRIEPLSEDGGVCLSRQVYDQVANKFELGLVTIGTKSLKNVMTPLEIFKIIMPWSPQTGRQSGQLDRRRIAVLPFTNMSADPNDEYFADGMTEELITTLSRVPSLKVIARTSVMGYKGSKGKINDIVNELGAGSLLEGSVRKSSNKLRIAVQLIDSQTSDYVWSETYDRDFEDIFTIQSDIARNVTDKLTAQLFSGEGQPRVGRTRSHSDAYNHYLKAKYFWNQRELGGFNSALKEFEKAITIDPSFAQAYAGLADTYLLLGRNGHVSSTYAYPKAIANAQKSISLDPNLAEPHVCLAAIKQEYEWKFDESESEFMESIAMDPGNPIAHSWYALYLGHVGRFDDAIAEAIKATDLDPLSPRAHGVASEEFLFARQYDKSIEAADKVLEIDPHFSNAYGYRAYALVEKREYDRAIADFREAGKEQGARAWMGRLGHALAISGDSTEARKIAEDLKKESGRAPPTNPFLPPPPDTAFDLGLVYLGLGDKQSAIDWMEKAVGERTAEVIHFKHEPIYDSIQEEQRFKALIRKIGIP